MTASTVVGQVGPTNPVAPAATPELHQCPGQALDLPTAARPHDTVRDDSGLGDVDHRPGRSARAAFPDVPDIVDNWRPGTQLAPGMRSSAQRRPVLARSPRPGK